MNHGFVINEFILFAGLNVSIDDKHATKERRIDYVNILKACSFLQQMLGKPVQVYLRRAEKIRYSVVQPGEIVAEGEEPTEEPVPTETSADPTPTVTEEPVPSELPDSYVIMELDKTKVK